MVVLDSDALACFAGMVKEGKIAVEDFLAKEEQQGGSELPENA